MLIIIGREELDAIAAVRAYAERHRIGRAVIQKYADGARPDPEAMARHQVVIPVGLCITFTLSESRRRDGTGYDWMRHFSACLLDGRPGLYPNPAMLDQVLPLFGFVGGLEACQVVIDDVTFPVRPSVVGIQLFEEGGFS